MNTRAMTGMEVPITLFAPATCVIRVRGTLGPDWSEQMGGMQITVDRSTPYAITELVGRLIDQAALHGVLAALYELGLPLISVACAASEVSSDQSVAAEAPRA